MRTIKLDTTDEEESKQRRQSVDDETLQKRQLEEEKKRREVLEEELLKFVQQRFKRDKLPWQRTISSEVFRKEILREFGNYRANAESLMRKVKQSSENVRLIQSGKGLIETFQSNTKNEQSR